MRARMDALKGEKEELEERVAAPEGQLVHLKVSREQESHVMAFAKLAKAGVFMLDFAGRRQMLRLLVEDVVCYDDYRTAHTIIPRPPSQEPVQLYTSPGRGYRGMVQSIAGQQVCLVMR